MIIRRGSKRRRCLARVGLFLISAALITGITGCTSADTDPSPPVWYTLTVSSTAGGAVLAPGEGTFTYEGGKSVSLVASPDTGYRFDRWTGDTTAIADVNAASTSITMNGDYSITASFVGAEEYTLTISSTAGGEVAEPGEGAFTYYEGTAVDLVATPDPGYRFDRWTGDTGTIAHVNSESTSITMSGDYSITASFVEIEEYTLTIASTAGGEVTDPGEGASIYYDGTVVDLVATPDPGYVFVNWTGDTDTIDDVSAASTTVTMNGDYSITANFVEIEEYELTISSTTGGSVTVTVDGQATVVGSGQTETIADITSGTGVDLAANPATGYRFVSWVGAPLDGSSNPVTTVTMNDNYFITANFAEIEEYELTISSTTGGSVTVTVDGQATVVAAGQTDTISDITEGTSVDLAASPASGYQFANWVGAPLDGSSNPVTTITMDSDYSITANFAEDTPQDEYDLTVSSTTGGSVTVTVDGQSTVVAAGQTQTISDITAGTEVDLAASAASGYQFANWVGVPLHGSSNPVATITMNGNYSITANFETEPPVQYNLTISSGTGGSVTVTVNTQQTIVGQGQTQTISGITAGTSVNLAASPANGYQFANWVGAPIQGSTDPVTTITMNGNYSIAAAFETEPPVQYNLTISSGTGGSVTVTVNTQQTIVGQGQTQTISDITAGTEVNLAASPVSGYLFANWVGTPIQGSTNPVTTVTMNADYSITASFAPAEGVVAFPDPNLEAAIREAIGKPTGPIYESDLNDLEYLLARNKKIGNLTGIEYCISLRTLDLRDNRISSIEPLAGLTSLTWLGLAHNRITDISPLAGLTNLRWLYLDGNQITDVSPLTNLTNLTLLGLWGNNIEDIKPLINNTGLGDGDRVYLQQNPLSTQSIEEHIPTLRTRGVDVYY